MILFRLDGHDHPNFPSNGKKIRRNQLHPAYDPAGKKVLAFQPAIRRPHPLLLHIAGKLPSVHPANKRQETVTIECCLFVSNVVDSEQAGFKPSVAKSAV